MKRTYGNTTTWQGLFLHSYCISSISAAVPGAVLTSYVHVGRLEARYRFDGDLIKEIEEEITAKSAQTIEAWIQKYGDKLIPTKSNK